MTGSTQLSTFGIGTSGAEAQWAEGTQDSIWFGATGDGHSASDWRAYSPTAPLRYADSSGVYAAGTVGETSNADHPYYAGFGSVAPPPAQTILFPTQTGATMPGSSAFEWHRVEIAKLGSIVTWTVDGLLIATVPLADDTEDTGNNIFLGHSDINTTSAAPGDGALIFTLIDNVQVIPEPSTGGMLALGMLVLVCRRRWTPWT